MAGTRQGVGEQTAMLRRLDEGEWLRYVRVEPPADGQPRTYVVEVAGNEHRLAGRTLPVWVDGFEAGLRAAAAVVERMGRSELESPLAGSALLDAAAQLGGER